MTKISDTKVFGKIFGDAIFSQSQLDKKHVINGKSLYGGALQKSADEIILETFKPSDSFVVFYVEHDMSEDTSTESVGDEITTYDSFICTISCYGDNFDIVAAKLYSRFLTEELLSDFESKGVHIQSIDNNDDLTDFLNGHLVKRRDLIVHFSSQIDVDKITEYTSMDEVGTMDVYTTR